MCKFVYTTPHTVIPLESVQPMFVFGHKYTFPLEHAVHTVTDGPVSSDTDYTVNMESTLYLVCSAVIRLVASMAGFANQHYCEITFIVDWYTWLSTNHLKLPMTQSWKLAYHYVVPFKVIK